MEQIVLSQKERLISILKREPTDRRTFISPGGTMSMGTIEVMEKTDCYLPEAHSDAEKMAKLAMAANRLTSAENIGIPFCTTVEAEAMGATVDLGTKEDRPRVVAYAIENIDDLGSLSPIDINSGRTKVCIEAIKIIKRKVSGVPIIANLVGPVTLATLLVESAIFADAVQNNKDSAHNLLKFAVENLIRFGYAMLEAGADIVCVSETAATFKAIDRTDFEEFVLPYANEMAEHFRDAFGAQSIIYFCGDFCGDIARFGDALSSISAEAIGFDSTVDVKAIKVLAKCKAIMGNVNTALLEREEPNAVFRAGMQSLISGVDILAPSCSVSLRTPIANARSLIHAVMRSDPPAPCC
ncbi:MAG: methylcobamide--CoM methyltransferase [Candidatus Aquicultor secundus]|uniref:Methylcobamide--CoM methyltransferase n=2 Tax=Candidatus Aquicultor secundus TaxID=1973895 RepID=A0A2M7TBV2_9ACTN|nr:uroporphyrinogen decarboxylase family protein [Candidatus Aquicultor secundus]NCO66666.1 methylcobamide--CoM methyltransferase [Solirubrobacter sp.]PIU27643.1 MAG: methylcobamide--CoM methyltransferase [Candidatus Aquicultor secundus]PIW23020.1 MAG: methylcobamide--CoM methyltransferase [Candidatus Aquicultor secundus]PIX52783.1 MAG: methylcobamide--CoM methyltransferase [Candidatus Aquicultor secundus]PIZ42244.1 MAG: methylcobamide--CoM methyltransferase [Candidatus Aquicultor secundus]